MHEIACSSHILGWSPLCSFARFTRSASVQFRCWTCRSWQNFLGSSCLVAYRQYHHSILIPHSCFHLAFALHTSITGGHSRCACSSLLSCLCCIYSFDLLPLLSSYPVCISIGSYLVIPYSQSCSLGYPVGVMFRRCTQKMDHTQIALLDSVAIMHTQSTLVVVSVTQCTIAHCLVLRPLVNTIYSSL